MEKKIEDYLHLYIGCFCKVDNRSHTHRLTGVKNGAALFRSTNGMVAMNNVKPILRPLADMTNGEIKEIGKIEGLANLGDIQKFGDDCIGAVDDTYKLMFETSPLTIVYLKKNGADYTLAKPFEITQYLLSKHFDLFGLIQAGLAIDITKL